MKVIYFIMILSHKPQSIHYHFGYLTMYAFKFKIATSIWSIIINSYGMPKWNMITQSQQIGLVERNNVRTYQAGAVWVLFWHLVCPSGVAALSLDWFFSVLWLLLTCSTPCFLRAESRNLSSHAEPCPFGWPFNRGTPLLEITHHYHTLHQARFTYPGPRRLANTKTRTDASTREQSSEL